MGLVNKKKFTSAIILRKQLGDFTLVELKSILFMAIAMLLKSLCYPRKYKEYEHLRLIFWYSIFVITLKFAFMYLRTQSISAVLSKNRKQNQH